EPARRFELLLPHEPRWVEEQVQRPQGHRQRLQEPPCPHDQEPRAVEDQSRESGRADHHPGSRDRRVAGPVGGVGGGVNKNKTPRRTPLRVGAVPGEGYRGQHTHLAYTSLRPGFWRLKIRPRFCSSSARKFSSPSGRPVRSCARRAFNSSSLMALVNRRRLLGAICKSVATCTRTSSRPLRGCDRAGAKDYAAFPGFFS